jgi:hypothetical protein
MRRKTCLAALLTMAFTLSVCVAQDTMKAVVMAYGKTALQDVPKPVAAGGGPGTDSRGARRGRHELEGGAGRRGLSAASLQAGCGAAARIFPAAMTRLRASHAAEIIVIAAAA